MIPDYSSCLIIQVIQHISSIAPIYWTAIVRVMSYK